jgi:hypothetical protein
MAKRSRKVKTITPRTKVSPNLYDFLGDLIHDTHWGASENDVATYVLTERLQQLKDAGYPKKTPQNPHKPTEQK